MSLLELDDVKVHFPIKKGVLVDRTVGHVYAVDGVSLKVEAGETYGLVGESGCGKTTLGRSVLRLVDITEGSVVLDGTDLAKLPGEEMRRFRRRLQMVFQDPLGSLNPRQNIESILSEGMIAHGIGKDQEERREKIKAILDKVGLPSNALARYPHEFSGGQRQRIGIARALVLEPDVIICDEPVSALDVSVQAQVINLLEELQQELGLTYLVIAHDLAVVRHISDTIGVMYLGSLVEEAPSDALYAEPKHPYTKALMSAVPVPDPEVEDKRERILLTGDLPSPANPPSGCRFHTRCPWARAERCSTERPQLRDVGGGHRVACHFAEEIESGKLALTRPTGIDAVKESEDVVVDERTGEEAEVPAALLTADSTTKPDPVAVKAKVPSAAETPGDRTADAVAQDSDAPAKDGGAATPDASGEEEKQNKTG
ncbi:dipeptide ABC transporter ATP-binding protein [Streptomyces sp. DSM 41972]|uniref:Dipeptide ABC transporter ATP-binding protein n=1 Tax=Streptomyces althioticus subsp. attaecolombicae TaxID=3075534 RepID=A0ABU3HV76_9ACTN|nr:dipeptide ABC transporter ATP-binding protein [Streptomyces sp. DSM 41972]SCD90937.1 peptide/nickel transport system ATP-binding protein [Streptomyces sp. di50b]SCE48702.1 peptide/nickel transport system ATP-binding protein [Streptomyces sp. di188]